MYHIAGRRESSSSHVLPMGKILTKSQLDANVSRDGLWVVVEQRFNDISLRPHFLMQGRVDGVDSAAIPLHFRTGAQLKWNFLAVRAFFTVTKENWAASVQNDDSRFPQFLCKAKTGYLTSLSKRWYILFTCCRLDTPHADNTLVKTSAKVIPSRYAQCDENGMSDSEGSKGAAQSAGMSDGGGRTPVAESLDGMTGVLWDLATTVKARKGTKKLQPVDWLERITNWDSYSGVWNL